MPVGTRVLLLAAVLALPLGPSARSAGQSPRQPATIAGPWTVTIANERGPVALDLQLEGQHVSGTFAGSAIVGEFKDHQLTCADPVSWAAWRAGTIGGDDAPVLYPSVVFATVKDDGTLAGWTDVFIRGYGPQAIKRMSWTATRATSTLVQDSAPPAVAGRWKAVFTDPIAEQPKMFADVLLDLRVEAGKLAGTAEMGNWPGLCPVSEGAIDGGHFSFVAIGSLWSSSGYPRITFDGTVRGDDMTLTLTWGYVGSGTTGRQLKMEGKKIRIER